MAQNCGWSMLHSILGSNLISREADQRRGAVKSAALISAPNTLTGGVERNDRIHGF